MQSSQNPIKETSVKFMKEKDYFHKAFYALDDFEEPIYFDQFELPTFKESMFPAWLKEYVKAVAESTQTPVDMAGMAAISVLSTALAKKFEINPYGDWVEPLNTYCLTLMGPANRKSSVFREMTRPITIFEKEEIERMEPVVAKRNSVRRSLTKRIEHFEALYSKNGDESIRQEISVVQEQLQENPELYLPTFATDDATPETLVTLLEQNNGKLAIISAEAGIFDMMNGRYSGKANLEVYLKGHSGDHIRVDRRGRTEVVEAPALTIGIFGQNDVIKDLPAIFQRRGLTARILYSIPKDPKGYRDIRPKIVPHEIRDLYNKYIKILISYSVEKPLMLSFDAEADILFKDFQERTEKQLREGCSLSDIPDWGGKLVGSIARITGLLHVSKHVEKNLKDIPLVICKETVYTAIMMEDYFIQHGLAALGDMKQNHNLEDAIYLLKNIKKIYKGVLDDTGDYHNPISYRNLQQRVKNRFVSKRLNILLKELEVRGFIEIQFDRSQIKPKKLIVVNPYILKK